MSRFDSNEGKVVYPYILPHRPTPIDGWRVQEPWPGGNPTPPVTAAQREALLSVPAGDVVGLGRVCLQIRREQLAALKP